jgi:DNA repair protein RadD
MIELRDYQQEARTATWDFIFRRPGNPIVCMPTGTGKSLQIADTCYCADFYIPGARVVVATHSKDLVEGNCEELQGYFPAANVGVYSASLKRADNPLNHQFMYVGIDSVYKKAAMFGFVHILIIDECHLVDSKEGTRYALFIAGLLSINPDMRIIGFSATAWRTKTGGLAQTGLFTDVCYDGCTLEKYNWFEDQGYLAKLIGKRTETRIILDNVRTSGGDFNLHDLAEATNEQITKAALEESADLGYTRRAWLVYGTDIAHVELMNKMLNNMGIPSEAVHSKQKGDRKPALQALKAGKLRALVSQGVLTTGVNLPCVDLIVQLRATKSSSLNVQIMGRGTRPVFAPGYDLRTREGRLAAQAAGPKQNCLVLDYARNIERLGPINDPWIPDGKKKGSGGGGGVAPVRCCDICNLYTHASKSHCDHCGAEFPVASKLTEESSNASPVAGIEEPIYEVWDIHTVTYHVHKSRNGGRCLRVTYCSGLSKAISEYVHCEAHPGSEPQRRAMLWLRERGMSLDLPRTNVEAVMKEINYFRQVSQVRVHVNRKFPEVVGVKFMDGAKSLIEGSGPMKLNFG